MYFTCMHALTSTRHACTTAHPHHVLHMHSCSCTPSPCTRHECTPSPCTTHACTPSPCMHAHPHHVLDMRAHPHHILDMRAHPHRSPHTTHACTLIPLYYACMHSCTPSPRIIHECKTLYLLHMLAHAHPRYAPRTSQFCMLGYACTFSPHCHAACMLCSPACTPS